MKSTGRIITTVIVVALAALAIWGWLALPHQAAEGEEGPWGGVDVTVIEKYAVDAGREPIDPYINTDQGDLLLFVFALGGAVGGFVAGYSWRRLVAGKS
ncbi:MAG TPA: cobalt transporter [Dehalococcoidia bacterium]|nr:cobalt transporter [Dehalococcoidia bacterium]